MRLQNSAGIPSIAEAEPGDRCCTTLVSSCRARGLSNGSHCSGPTLGSHWNKFSAHHLSSVQRDTKTARQNAPPLSPLTSQCLNESLGCKGCVREGCRKVEEALWGILPFFRLKVYLFPTLLPLFLHSLAMWLNVFSEEHKSIVREHRTTPGWNLFSIACFAASLQKIQLTARWERKNKKADIEINMTRDGTVCVWYSTLGASPSTGPCVEADLPPEPKALRAGQVLQGYEQQHRLDSREHIAARVHRALGHTLVTEGCWFERESKSFELPKM